MSDTRKIVKAWWFHAGSQCYGIVETKDDLGFVKHYIGQTYSNSPNEAFDAQMIITFGARFRIPSDLSTEHDAP